MIIAFISIESFLAFIFLVCAVLSLPALFGFFKGANKTTRFPESENATNFAVIVPARDESKVIEGNIRSVLSSDYPKDKRTVFIIVESETDETVRIAEKYENVRVFVRKNMTGVGKGYALDECLQEIFAGDEKFDAILILDADNLIKKDFLSKMNDAYQAGYDLACGKRDNNDWNVSATSAASGLTFTLINTLMNKPKTYLGKTILISGTGFFVRAKQLEDMGGWKFHSLTEDYEITTYADCENWKTCYVEEAVYYDEQPIKLWPSIVQRSRWVKGFFTVRGKYAKMKRAARKKAREQKDKKRKFTFKSGMPIIVLCIDLIAYMVCLFAFLIVSLFVRNGTLWWFVWRLVGLLSTFYVFIALLTVYILIVERKSMDITPKMRIKATLFHPIFLFTYVIAAVRAIFMPNTWEKIDHVINKDIE